MSLEAISPAKGPLVVGLAGETPVGIARYLLANGADATSISPDGRFIAIRRDITGTRQVWIVPSEGGQPWQLTFGNGITFFRWTPDSGSILYGADNDGNEREAYYLVSVDGNEERVVLDATENGFRRFGDFDANGDSLYFSSTERNGLDFDIYLANINGQPKRIFEGSYAYYVQSVSPDGKSLIVSESVG
jgi:Tol biopolymer transport system component